MGHPPQSVYIAFVVYPMLQQNNLIFWERSFRMLLGFSFCAQPACERTNGLLRGYCYSICAAIDLRVHPRWFGERLLKMKTCSFLTNLIVGSHVLQGSAATSSPDSMKIDNNGTSPSGVVIMAQGRSGSTMLGSLFSSNEVCAGS